MEASILQTFQISFQTFSAYHVVLAWFEAVHLHGESQDHYYDKKSRSQIKGYHNCSSIFSNLQSTTGSFSKGVKYNGTNLTNTCITHLFF